MRARHRSALGLAALLAALSLAACGRDRGAPGPSPEAAPAQAAPAPAAGRTAEAPAVAPDQIWHAAQSDTGAVAVPTQASLAPLVKQLKPGVVNISSTSVIRNPHRGLRIPGGGGGGGDDDDGPFRFFGPQGPQMKSTSLGSGFIINAEGYVLTNNHVVENATDIKVRLSDGREFEAKLVGRDPGTDVALIKLQKVEGKLPTVALGDSDALEQGDFVLAIGSPLGFRESVSFGIVSAKDRTLTGNPFDDFLQTDAAINQGNSGGPLFNMRGEVVGINTAIVSPQIGSGIGFAVPINIAKQLMPQLMKGKVARGFLGVTVAELTPDLAEGFGYAAGTKGVLVQSVMPNKPGAKAGLRDGDLVVAVNGKPVTTPGELTRAVSAVAPGGKVQLTALRGQEKKEFTVTVAQRPDEEALARGDSPDEDQDEVGAEAKGGEKLGLRVENLTAQAARQLGLDSEKGVRVVGVAPDGPAASAGLRPNDVILEVNRQPVGGTADMKAIIGKAKPGSVAVLRVQRGNVAQYVPVRLGGEKK